MKILVVFTGGTIGSKLSEGFISPDGSQNKRLTESLESADFEYAQPYFILSEQLNGDNITALVRCVGENLNRGYDGIIVTHGTDTLQYSAAALSLAFGKAEIPIVLASSNYVLDDSRSNGRENFKYAVEFIREGIGGVFVSCKNTGCLPEIYCGSRLLPHEIYSDELKSLGSCFGYFKGERFIRTGENAPEDNLGAFCLNRFSPVLWLRAYPGMRAVGTEGFKAVLLEGYHSATLPTLSEEFVRFCKGAQIPLFFLGAKKGAGYESSKLFEELGIKILPEISPVYAYVKLWAATDNGIEIMESKEK